MTACLSCGRSNGHIDGGPEAPLAKGGIVVTVPHLAGEQGHEAKRPGYVPRHPMDPRPADEITRSASREAMKNPPAHPAKPDKASALPLGEALKRMG